MGYHESGSGDYIPDGADFDGDDDDLCYVLGGDPIPCDECPHCQDDPEYLASQLLRR